MPTARCRKCMAMAWSVSSRTCNPASVSATPVARYSRLRWAQCRAAIPCRATMARVSMRPSRPSAWPCPASSTDTARMARYAIGDIQGCHQPLRELLRQLRFSADRDQLRFVRDLGDNARTVLGNHDLHLLAHHFDPSRPLRDGDTLQQVLQAPDRE